MLKKFSLHNILLVMLAMLGIAGCTYPQPSSETLWDSTPKQRDSIAFRQSHHYSISYNFFVSGDSLLLLPQTPADLIESLSDTALVRHGDRIVVADIEFVPADTVDSVWVKVARDQSTIGWVHEKDLLRNTVPQDPISKFIHLFGNRRIITACIIAAIAVAILLIRTIRRKKIRVVHFNDIDSSYPAVLCVLMAMLATIYASVQHFYPETWQEFYFNPTLNPFAVPFSLSALLICFWGIIIMGIAAVDDVTHKLAMNESLPYLLSLVAMIMVIYLVFAVTTIIYIGYPLLVAYIVFAIVMRRRSRTFKYVCGRCGHHLRHKGTCPYCGARNV